MGIAALNPSCELHADKDDAGDQQGRAGDADRADGMDREAQHTEMIEDHGAEHLAGDQEREEGRCAELRNQENRKADKRAPNMPPVQANQGTRDAVATDGSGSCSSSASATMQMTPRA